MCCKRFLLIAVFFCGFGVSELRAQGWLGARGYLPSPEWQQVGAIGDQFHPVLPYLYSAFFFFDPVHAIIATTEPALYYISPQVSTRKSRQDSSGFHDNPRCPVHTRKTLRCNGWTGHSYL